MPPSHEATKASCRTGTGMRADDSAAHVSRLPRQAITRADRNWLRGDCSAISCPSPKHTTCRFMVRSSRTCCDAASGRTSAATSADRPARAE
jgi:hypothetical protein